MKPDRLPTGQILDLCIARLRAGESLERCLADYPDAVDEIAPLLELSLDLIGLPPLESRPEAVTRGRDAMFAAFDVEETRAAAATKERATYQDDTGWLAGLKWLWTSPKMVTRFAFLLIGFVLAASAVAGASASTLPGETLYPVKRLIEEARLSLTLDRTNQEQLMAELDQRRREEVKALIGEGQAARVQFSGRLNRDGDGQWRVDDIPIASNDSLEGLLAALEGETVVVSSDVAADGGVILQEIDREDGLPVTRSTPTPIPTVTPTPSSTSSPTLSPSSTATEMPAVATSLPTRAASETPTAEPVASATIPILVTRDPDEPSPAATLLPEAEVTPTATVTSEPTPTEEAVSSVTAAPTEQPSSTTTARPTETAQATGTSPALPNVTVTAQVTAGPTETRATASPTPAPTERASATPGTNDLTPRPVGTAVIEPTAFASATTRPSPTASRTPERPTATPEPTLEQTRLSITAEPSATALTERPSPTSTRVRDETPTATPDSNQDHHQPPPPEDDS
ncbi:MAG: DUF5667 domain-containing protein [Chloroflexota bacterium]